jgi:hypothetical protein
VLAAASDLPLFHRQQAGTGDLDRRNFAPHRRTKARMAPRTRGHATTARRRTQDRCQDTYVDGKGVEPGTGGKRWLIGDGGCVPCRRHPERGRNTVLLRRVITILAVLGLRCWHCRPLPRAGR